MNNYFASFYSQVLLSLLKKVEKTFIFTQKWLDLRGSGNYATFPPPPPPPFAPPVLPWVKNPLMHQH